MTRYTTNISAALTHKYHMQPDQAIWSILFNGVICRMAPFGFDEAMTRAVATKSCNAISMTIGLPKKPQKCAMAEEVDVCC